MMKPVCIAYELEKSSGTGGILNEAENYCSFLITIG